MLELVTPATLSKHERKVNSLLYYATLCATVAVGVRMYRTRTLPSQASKKNKKSKRTKYPKGFYTRETKIPGFPGGMLRQAFDAGVLRPLFVYPDFEADNSQAYFHGRFSVQPDGLIQRGEVYDSERYCHRCVRRRLVGLTYDGHHVTPPEWFIELLRKGDISLNYDDVFTLPNSGLNDCRRPLVSQASVRQFTGFGIQEPSVTAKSHPVMYTDASQTARSRLQTREAKQSSLAGFSMDSVFNDEATRRENMKFITFKTKDAARGALNGPTGQCIGVQDPEVEKLARDFNVLVQTSPYSNQEVSAARAEELLSSDDVGY